MGPERVRRRAKEDWRLSERLSDLVVPYCDGEDELTFKRYELLIGAAVTAWNLSLLPEVERPVALRKAFRHARVSDVEPAAEIIVGLMRRKEQLFPDDDRGIMSWKVYESDGEYHVAVASVSF